MKTPPNKAEFKKLVEETANQLLGFLCYLGVPESMREDIAQETYLRAYLYFDKFSGERPFLSWIGTIGRNVFNDRRKKFAQEKETIETFEPVPHSNPEEEVLTKRSVEEILEFLTEEEKFLVEMRIIKDFSFSELSEMTGQTEVNLRVRYHRMLQKIRNIRRS
ncbi:MAG: RNA polymerase sigma factor [Candidatus Riflebacteria bacterium]|nr:RNA polymerase sigma factor [Candidatus Riflebacteria bacterium]